MATLTNQLHTVSIYITTSTVPYVPNLSRCLEHFITPNRAPPRPPSAPNIARERAFDPWSRADGTAAAAKDSPTTIRPQPLRAGICTQWSRRRCPPRSLAKTAIGRLVERAPRYCIASRRELFTGSAAGCMRAHSSICGTTDSGAYSRLSFWAPVILPAPSVARRRSTIEPLPDQMRR